MLTGQKYAFLNFFAVVFTLGEMIFLCLFILFLVIFAVRYRNGKWVPRLDTLACRVRRTRINPWEGLENRP